MGTWTIDRGEDLFENFKGRVNNFWVHGLDHRHGAKTFINFKWLEMYFIRYMDWDHRQGRKLLFFGKQGRWLLITTKCRNSKRWVYIFCMFFFPKSHFVGSSDLGVFLANSIIINLNTKRGFIAVCKGRVYIYAAGRDHRQ